MPNVLFIIHIPYEKNCRVNTEILKKKRDTENELISTSTIFSKDDGKEEKEDEVETNVEVEEENKIEKKESIVSKNGEVKNLENSEDANPFFPSEETKPRGDTLRKDTSPPKEGTPPKETSPPGGKAKEKEKKVNNKMLNRYLSYNLTEIFYLKLKENNITRASWEFTEDGEYWQIMFQIDSKNCDKLLNDLLKVGIGNNDYSSISVVPVTVNFPSMLKGMTDEVEAKEKGSRRGFKVFSTTQEKKFFDSVRSRLTVAQVIDAVRNGSELTFDYMMLITMASIIAGIGLVENSSVLLVASMLVSPLMGPILGGTFGMVLNFKSLAITGLRNETIGLTMCLVIGFFMGLVFGLFSGTDAVTSEMSSRCAGRSLLVGFFVAVPSGAGVALSILGGNAGSLVGVAISASLLPPAVNAGIFYAFSLISVFFKDDGGSTTVPILPSSVNDTAGIIEKKFLRDFEPSELATMGTFSLLLTLVNILVIIIMGVMVLKVKEVAPNTGTAVTKKFWKYDLKKTREFLSRHMMSWNSKLTDTVLEEYGELNDVNLQNVETLKGEKGRKLAKNLKKCLENLEIDPSYNAVNQKVVGKTPMNSLKRLVSRLETDDKGSRFTTKRVFEIAESTFDGNSRFMINRLQEVDNVSITNSTFELDMAGTERVKTKLPINKQPLLKDTIDDSLV